MTLFHHNTDERIPVTHSRVVKRSGHIIERGDGRKTREAEAPTTPPEFRRHRPVHGKITIEHVDRMVMTVEDMASAQRSAIRTMTTKSGPRLAPINKNMVPKRWITARPVTTTLDVLLHTKMDTKARRSMPTV